MYKPKSSEPGGVRTGVEYIDDSKYRITQIRMWEKIRPLNSKGVGGKR